MDDVINEVVYKCQECNKEFLAPQGSRRRAAEAKWKKESVEREMYEALKQAQEGTGDWRGMIDMVLAKANGAEGE